MARITMRWPILATFALLGLSISNLLVGSENISIPNRCRTEGRLTLMYQQGERTLKRYLAFNEALDTVDMKYVVSIGMVSYPPTKYYSISGQPTLTIDTDDLCTPVAQAELTTFIPELSWFVDMLLPGVNMTQFVSTSSGVHFVGPTGLLTLLLGLAKSREFKAIDDTIVHRNIPCKVYRKMVSLPVDGLKTQIDIYKPISGVEFRNLQSTYFSIKATTTHEGSNTPAKETTSLVIDFFNIDSMDGDPSKLDRMKYDFNLPFASGCSEFLEQIQPEIDSKTFSMNYNQRSSSDSILLAYDHESGFLRREKYGESISIWDMNENLMYHIDVNMTNIQHHAAYFLFDHKTCSVSKVTDENLGPAFVPYDNHREYIEILKLIGAEKVAYLGKGTVRDLPCSIYETILPEAPDLFALTSERPGAGNKDYKNPSSSNRDYIVLYHLLQGSKDPGDKFGLMPTLTDDSFWPAQILLYRRTKYSNSSRIVEFIDQLDIYDFSWSLDGWGKKNNELFMASECFDDEDEQIRLELAITFDLIHQENVRAEDRKLLPYNRHKLENDLINDIFSLLKIRKIHLVEYELRLRPHHVDLNMIIGDRKEVKVLTYFGTGTINTDSNNYLQNAVFLTQLSEENCVAASSLLPDISLVVHCPSYQTGPNSIYDSTCLMVTGDSEPAIILQDGKKNTNGFKEQQPNCQVYRFSSSLVQRKVTLNVDSNKSNLMGHNFDFVAQIPGGDGRGEIIKGTVKNYDISHEVSLIVINHYTFTTDSHDDSNHSQTKEDKLAPKRSKNVRTIESITYRSLGDCLKICNLDVNCRSFSFCANGANQCILSSLDLRSAKLQDQLMHSTIQVSENKTILIDGDRFIKYELEFLDHCDIYERDYLNIYRPTEEFVRLQRKSINQFRVASTTFDCAKQSVDLESSSSNHHVAMFAYCPSSNTCLLDENLFASTENETAIVVPDDTNDSEELFCKIYRKKYQTYFDVSAKVLRKQPEHQVELGFETVEECARACWNRFGQVCASFDYCSPKSCLINTIDTDSSEAELELRPDCLHYERDLELDELRRRHMIGRQEILQEKKEVRTFGGTLLSIFTYFLVFCAFVYGLVLGRQVNDKMEAVTILRQSISAASGQRARQMSGFLGTASNSDHYRDGDGSSSFDTIPDQVGSNAIRLSVIKSNRNGDNEPLDQDF